nr:hypothetical protein [uncultured Shinella sp.]
MLERLRAFPSERVPLTFVANAAADFILYVINPALHDQRPVHRGGWSSFPRQGAA